MLSRVKLIAEPWDIGPDGYRVGDFPSRWSEWNGRYRDTVRDFWRGTESTLPDFATRVSGSSDLYGHGGRRPAASVNFVTAHDGFTLADLVAYERKHNEANGEDNRDGTDDNRSANYGVEGPTTDPDILERCARASAATCSPRCCSARACRCCWAATRWGAPRAATTTPTARTTRPAGSTGRPPTTS